MASNDPQFPHKNGDIIPNVPRRASSADDHHHAHSSAHSLAGHDTSHDTGPAASSFDDRHPCRPEPAEAGANRSVSLVRRSSKPVPQTTDPAHVKGQITTAAKTALPSLSLPSQPSSSSSMHSVPVDQSHASLTMACAATALPPTFRLQPGNEPSLLPEPTCILPSLETAGQYGRKSSVSMDLVDEGKHKDGNEEKQENPDDEDDEEDTLHGSAATFRKRTEQSIAPFLTKHIAAQYASRGRDQSQNDRSNTKYCYRHRPDLKCRRAANEPSMEQLQNELTALPQSDQQGISQVWSLFSAAPAKHRTLILQGLLAQCCFPQLSFVSASVRELLKIDFISALPSELSLKIMCYLDPTSLCKAAQVSQKWTEMANDDVVWHRMCEQHIDRKCSKCGWGLPLLDKYRLRMERRQMQARAKGRQLANHERVSLSPAPQSVDVDSHGSLETLEKGEGKRRFVEHALAAQSPGKRQCPPSDRPSDRSYFQARRKPWKDVYRDRFRIGTNWKYGRYTLKTFNGHTNGVICLQYDNEVLATGSYDCTIKVWDMETGTELRTLTGHTLGVRCLQFDDSKLVSGGLDGKIKIWNMRTGDLMRTLEGGEGGVIGLHLAGSILACGSADKTIKVWNFKTREDFVLHGHEEWVNSVKVDTVSRTLFSGGDDCKVYLWDLDERRIIKSFEGHVAQVQQVLPLASDFDYFDPDDASDGSGPAGQQSERKSSAETRWTDYSDDPKNADRKPPPRYLLTAGLDSMIRLWDVWTGRSVRMFWGHLEGIWALAADSLRLVSASNDGMVKVWDPRTGNCETTLTGHQGPVTCVDLSDRRMCTGSEDHTVRLYTFDP